jgi:Tfp pilus assembly protein PilV
MFVKKLSNSGETIIEVLIALTIISSALGGAFAIASSSSKTIQSDKERYQAQLYANQQAAWLRAYAPIAGYTPITGNFCMTTEKTLAVDTDPACTLDALFKVSIIGCAQAGYCVYHIKVTWDALLSSNPNIVELYYGT